MDNSDVITNYSEAQLRTYLSVCRHRFSTPLTDDSKTEKKSRKLQIDRSEEPNTMSVS